MSFFDKITAQLPFGSKPLKAEYFFALSVGLSKVTAVVWSMFGNELDVLGHSASSYEGNDDLVDKSYQALNKALDGLDIEPQKVLFGVPDSWSVEDNLKDPYLKILQRMLKEFDLAPLAYVTTTNAISFMIQKQEGIPPTNILFGIGNFVEITLVRGGKVAGTRTFPRGEHLFEDIEKTLGQFTEVEVLPSKILLYATKQNEDLGKIKDDLMSYPWMQRLSFLHFPKIDVLEEGVEVEATVYAGASELNSGVDLKHSFSLKKPDQTEHFTKTLVAEPAETEDRDLGFVKGDI
ncbi:MAG: hypothetical protein V1808_04180, partial [Candidatus Daviesbacteria bacterium]